MWKRTVKVIGWSFGSIVAVSIVLYSIAVAVNWNDREPSEMARHFENQYRNRPTVANADNAYIYVLGFNVPWDQDPQPIGERRAAWIEASNRAGRFDNSGDPFPNTIDATHLKDVREFFDICKPGSMGCKAAYDKSDVMLQEILTSESEMLRRYQKLLERTEWVEAVPVDPAAPLPAYHVVLNGQKLLLAKATLLARKNDVTGVRELLAADLRFWRNVLESADTLITKMIATVAINRNFEVGSLILRSLRPAVVTAATPAEWHVAITGSQRSMSRCMVGEWIFASGLLRGTPDHLSGNGLILDAEGESGFRSKMVDTLLSPFYKVQDSINRYAEYYSRVSGVLNAPLGQYETVAANSDELRERTTREAFSAGYVYNFMGSRLLSAGAYDFLSYGIRVADIEGVRRAAVLAVTLREKNVAIEEIEEALRQSSLRNPYDNEPFGWDAKSKAIVFTGLEPGERGTHRIYY